MGCTNSINTLVGFISSTTVIMGKYSHTDLISKSICFYSILKHLSIPLLILPSAVYILLMIRVLNDRRISCDLIRLCVCLQNNSKGSSQCKTSVLINQFIKAGYVTGKTSFKITELGRAHLHDIDQALQRAVVRVSVKDNLFSSLPVSKESRQPRVLGDI